MDDTMETMPPERQGPTFEDLTFDDSLDDMQRIARYATSPIALQRLVHVKLMSDTAHAFGFTATRASMFSLLSALVNDEEFVLRQHLAEQLKGLAEVCVQDGGAEGYASMLEEILPAMARLVADGQPDVRIAAGEALVAVAALVKKEDLGARVLTIVLQLAHDDEKEDLRMTAAVLLNELAETLGPELCHQFVTPEVICLAEDPVFRVRKAAALNIDAICRTVGPVMAMKRLVPAFLRLCADDIWGVRKACAGSLVAVSKCLDPQIRVTALVPVFDAFANDQSKWVRNEALKHFGPFLATLPGKNVTPALLAHFTRIGLPHDPAAAAAAPSSGHTGSAPTPATSGTAGGAAGGHTAAAAVAPAVRAATDAADAELVEFCAFSFPAVVFTLGRTRWIELRALFNALSRDPQRKVRRPLAHALHEIAKIIGPDAAEADLLPAFELYLKDVDEVKIGIVRHLASFLSALSPSTRESYLPLLDELLPRMDDYARIIGTEELNKRKETLNWRLRKLLAGQLPQLCTIFSPAATFSVVTPFSLRLLADPVATVREEAVCGVASLVNRLGDHDASLQMDVLLRLLKLCESSCFRERILFLRVVTVLGDATTGIDTFLFRRYVLPILVSLAFDRVRNVRLGVSRLLARISKAMVFVEDYILAQTAAAGASLVPPMSPIVRGVSASAPTSEGKSASPPLTRTAAAADPTSSSAAATPSRAQSTGSATAAASSAFPSTPLVGIAAAVRDALGGLKPVTEATSPPWLSRAPRDITHESDTDLQAKYPLPVLPGIDDDDFPLWARADSELLAHAFAALLLDRDAEVVASLYPEFVRRIRAATAAAAAAAQPLHTVAEVFAGIGAVADASSASIDSLSVLPLTPAVLSAARRRSQSLSPPPPPIHTDVRQVFDDGLSELAASHAHNFAHSADDVSAGGMLADEDGMSFGDAEYAAGVHVASSVHTATDALAALALDNDVEMTDADVAPVGAAAAPIADTDADADMDLALEDDLVITLSPAAGTAAAPTPVALVAAAAAGLATSTIAVATDMEDVAMGTEVA